MGKKFENFVRNEVVAESIEGKEELRNQEFMVDDLEELKAFPFIN